ncbi:MAG: endolysin [Fusobacteriales bacterium]|nr:MAG: endolysin [Fusobacteriales bacterium]
MFVYSESSREKLKGVHPQLVDFFEELIKIAPHDFKITEGVRTLEKQQEYYSWGRTIFETPWGTKLTKPVTKIDGIRYKSKHQIQADGYSHAVDIAFVGNNQAECYDVNKFKTLRKVAEPLMNKYGVFWGGNWKKFIDMPHWQLIK